MNTRRYAVSVWRIGFARFDFIFFASSREISPSEAAAAQFSVFSL